MDTVVDMGAGLDYCFQKGEFFQRGKYSNLNNNVGTRSNHIRIESPGKGSLLKYVGHQGPARDYRGNWAS